MSRLDMTLPAPCSFETALTFDADGYFKKAKGQGANRDAIRMTRNGRLSISAMAAMLTELRHSEEAALKAFTVAENTYGVQGEHLAKDKAQRAVCAASSKALRLLDWIAAARPSTPDDIGRQIKAILSVSSDVGIIERGQLAALSAASSALMGEIDHRPK